MTNPSAGSRTLDVTPLSTLVVQAGLLAHLSRKRARGFWQRLTGQSRVWRIEAQQWAAQEGAIRELIQLLRERAEAQGVVLQGSLDLP